MVNNPLLCDPASGVCEIPAAGNEEIKKTSLNSNPIRIIYYTDPICSSCWGIEPQLRKLKLQYSGYIAIEYRMGGLLPDWSYNSGGISKPSDVAEHWEEAGRYYNMPIDGGVWLEDPLESSYPPSIAFKAAQLQDTDKGISFLRTLRELLFLEKKNIGRWEIIEQAAVITGLDAAQLKKDTEGKAQTLFEEDLQLARQLGVRGFPSMFFVDHEGRMELVYGARPYEVYESAIKKTIPQAVPNLYNKSWENLFSKFPTLTVREFSELAEIPQNDARLVLEKLHNEGSLTKIGSKNGPIWKTKAQ